jgi:hypothetical protein
MKPFRIGALLLGLMVLPGCSAEQLPKYPYLRQVVFTLPKAAYWDAIKRVETFAAERGLGFATTVWPAGGFRIEAWRGYDLLSDFRFFMSEGANMNFYYAEDGLITKDLDRFGEIASFSIIDGVFRRASPGIVESLSGDLEKVLVEIPGVQIVRTKTCPCLKER